MGKTFIADEVNDMYVAKVTNAKKLWIEDGAASFVKLSGNRLAVGATATAVSTGPCYFKSIILGQAPATATYLSIYDCDVTVSGSNLSAFGTTAANILARLYLDASAGVSANGPAYPKAIPFNVYCSSGLVMALGEGYVPANLSGCCSAITVIYQT